MFPGVRELATVNFNPTKCKGTAFVGPSVFGIWRDSNAFLLKNKTGERVSTLWAGSYHVSGKD